MHQVLYRKWRPRTFDDVCGQDHITSVLRYEVEHEALNHAYLFCGSRGTGKTTCAKILAKAVNCLNPHNGSPCGECAACRAIDNGSATDVIEMDAASNNGVENIRDIRDEVVYTPSSLRYRVYIVDEVHMLSPSAFNALLKTLEEPPAHVIFILATTELQKLPATIISRCQRFDFHRIASPVLAARVSYIAKEEGIDLLPEAADRIAKLAQGGMRDAISLLELCAGTSGTVDAETVNTMVGSTGRGSMISLVNAVLDADYDGVFGAVADAVSASRDLLVFWSELIGLYRDLLVMKTTDHATRYLDLTDAETAELKALADRFKKSTLLAHSHLLEEALFAMQKANAVKRMVAELTLVRLCDPMLDTSNEGLLARLTRVEDTLAAGVLPPQKAEKPQKREAEPPAATPAPPAPEQEKKPQSPPQPQKGGRVLRRLRGFANCVERVTRENAMLGSFLGEVKAFLDEKERVVLQLPNEFAQVMIEEEDGKLLLRRALSVELKREISDAMLLMEVRDEKADQKDSILDDLLESAGDSGTSI